MNSNCITRRHCLNNSSTISCLKNGKRAIKSFGIGISGLKLNSTIDSATTRAGDWERKRDSMGKEIETQTNTSTEGERQRKYVHKRQTGLEQNSTTIPNFSLTTNIKCYFGCLSFLFHINWKRTLNISMCCIWAFCFFYSLLFLLKNITKTTTEVNIKT